MHSGQLKQQDIPVMVRMNIPRDVFNDSAKAVHERKNQPVTCQSHGWSWG